MATPTFSFPVTYAGPPSNIDEERLMSTGYLEPSESEPSFSRWVPARRQRSVGTSSSKQLAQLHHAPSGRHPGYPNADEGVSVQGDLSVCIGLTVQCSPMGSLHTSAPSYVTNTRRHVTPRCGSSAVDPAAVISWRNSHPTRLGPVRSCDDVQDYRSRWQRQRQVDSFRYFVQDASKFHRDRRSHPLSSVLPPHPAPQRALGRDFRVSHPAGIPFAADWKGPPHAGPSFEDFAVGFENEASTSVPDDLSEDVRGQSGFLDEKDELAFDEITQQIASLTQTVNELRCKHRRPVTTSQNSDDAAARAWNCAVFRRGDATRKQR